MEFPHAKTQECDVDLGNGRCAEVGSPQSVHGHGLHRLISTESAWPCCYTDLAGWISG